MPMEKNQPFFLSGCFLWGCPVAIKTEQFERKIAKKIGTGFFSFYCHDLLL
jgi:hypothetical protein